MASSYQNSSRLMPVFVSTALAMMALVMGCGPDDGPKPTPTPTPTPIPCPVGDNCYELSGSGDLNGPSNLAGGFVTISVAGQAIQQEADGSVVTTRDVNILVADGNTLNLNITMEDTITGSSFDGSQLTGASGGNIITECEVVGAGAFSCDSLFGAADVENGGDGLDAPYDLGSITFVDLISCDHDNNAGTPNVDGCIDSSSATRDILFDVPHGGETTYSTQLTIIGQTAYVTTTLTACDPCDVDGQVIIPTPSPDPDEIDPVTDTVLVRDESDRDACATSYPDKHPFFGDTHVHTTYSVDAYSQDVRTTQTDAYDFAQGAVMDLPPYLNGAAQRTRELPAGDELDFVMLSDHAEFFGDVALCTNENSLAYDHPSCVQYRARNFDAFIGFNSLLFSPQAGTSQQDYCGSTGSICNDHSITLWQQTQLAAEAAYDRTSACSFTTFIGYEWSGSPGLGSQDGVIIQNLHRNVLFANAVVPARPISYFNAPYPEQLWEQLTTDCLDAPAVGEDECNVLTIPHNSNLSAGIMFEQLDQFGAPIDTAYAQTRAAFEPMVELIQHKGNSECLGIAHGGTDEECGFEYLPWGQLSGNLINDPVLGPSVVQVDPTEPSFVRNALKEGLSLQASAVGVNPFKYGFIGSTDTHMSAPGMVNESDYPGHGGAANAGQAPEFANSFVDNWEHNTGALAVVWAHKNTRTDLFQAMQAKEVYTTSGPRHVLRFFGGWDFDPTEYNVPNDPSSGILVDSDMCNGTAPPVPMLTWVETAYANGVPMGSDLNDAASIPAPIGVNKPTFYVAVSMDEVPLHKIQIIKGMEDGSEQVVDVLTAGTSGSVDTDDCTINSLPAEEGDTDLCVAWTDSSFDPTENAFYYARVLEDQTCRWTTYACNAVAGLDCNDLSTVPDDMEAGCCGVPADLIAEPPTPYIPPAPATHQERSWSSPIWYNAP